MKHHPQIHRTLERTTEFFNGLKVIFIWNISVGITFIMLIIVSNHTQHTLLDNYCQAISFVLEYRASSSGQL